MSALKSAVLTFHQKPVMAKAHLPQRVAAAAQVPGVVVNIKPSLSKRPFVAARVVPHTSRVAVAAAR
jgi:hypothetical protein